MKSIVLIGLIILGCVGFRDVDEKPNEVYLDNVIIYKKNPMTIAELDAWAETARFGKLR